MLEIKEIDRDWDWDRDLEKENIPSTTPGVSDAVEENDVATMTSKHPFYILLFSLNICIQ